MPKAGLQPVVRLLALWAMPAVPALAQSGLIPQVQLNGVQRIAPGGSDLDPLRGNPRVLPTDLRAPMGFEDVFQLRSTDRFGREQSAFARRSGGLTAVFPRSVYVPSRNGLVPEVPAGTVFIIGEDHTFDAPPQGLSRSFNAMSFTAPLVSAQQMPEPPAPVRSTGPRPTPINESIWKNEEFRKRQIERLLTAPR